MDDIPVYFMMFIYIYIYIVYDVYHVTSHITSTYYCNTLHFTSVFISAVNTGAEVQTCPNEATHCSQDSWPLAPIPCWSWHWLIQALIWKKTGWVIWEYSVALGQESDMACWKISYLVRCFFHENYLQGFSPLAMFDCQRVVIGESWIGLW